MVVVSDPGVGVIKAGWHCGGDPAPSGTPHDCPVCQECDGDKCVPISEAVDALQAKEQQDCDDGNECTTDLCEGDNCVHNPLDDTPCDDDGNPCTEDVCDNGTCTHPEVTCMECERCDPDAGGNCAPDPEQDGNQCMDEGDPSCSIDRCRDGMCMHTPLEAPGDYDPDPLGVDIEGMNQGTQDALTCFQREVTNAGGTIVVTSAFRPQSYQDHLRDVWLRYQEYVAADAEGYTEPECDEIIQEIEEEWRRHRIVAEPVRVSNHTAGNAFDADVDLPPGEDRDDLADRCGLNRPDRNGDPVHYVH
jgi:hypothetical protein